MPASPEPAGALADRLARAITLAGPIPLSQFMAAANAEYYSTADAIGGDFITAPEISQMFGELIGVALAELWGRAGRPDCRYVELGPGRGTLAADALRSMAKAGLRPRIDFVETSGSLPRSQLNAVPGAAIHRDMTTLSDNAPLIVVANEFFDALPIEQIVRTADGWHRRMVACQDTLFLPVTGKPVPEGVIPEPLRDAPPGSIIETSPASVKTMRELARRLASQGGAAIIADYGYDGPAAGETLQAVRGHAFANPFDAPGSVDLSAHVDFTTLAAAARAEGCTVHGPVPQRDFLGQMGIAQRAAALARATPEAAADIAAAHRRLTDPAEMGTLFRAMAVTGGGWPAPAGFA